MANRLGQGPVEAINQSDSGAARVTQGAVEALVVLTPYIEYGNRLSQACLEIATQGVPYSRLTQDFLEVIIANPVTLERLLSQAALEAVTISDLRAARASQAGSEVLITSITALGNMFSQASLEVLILLPAGADWTSIV